MSKAKPKVKLPGKQEISITEFRSRLSKLKKAGIIPKDTNIRKVRPTRHYARLIDKNKDVISGRKQAVRVSGKTARDFADQGYIVRGKNVILPKDEYKRYYEKNGRILSRSIKKNDLYDTIKVPIRFKNMEQFLDDLKTKSPDLQHLIGDGYRLAFRYFGNFQLAGTFPNFYSMVDYLERYTDIEDAMAEDDEETQREQYIGLEFIRTQVGKLPANPKTPKPPRMITYEQRMRSIRKNPARQEKQREYERVHKKRQRAKMSPEKRKQENQKRVQRRRDQRKREL